MAERKQVGRPFEKGQSGNPSGRVGVWAWAPGAKHADQENHIGSRPHRRSGSPPRRPSKALARHGAEVFVLTFRCKIGCVQPLRPMDDCE
jgi:hypothetical protein